MSLQRKPYNVDKILRLFSLKIVQLTQQVHWVTGGKKRERELNQVLTKPDSRIQIILAYKTKTKSCFNKLLRLNSNGNGVFTTPRAEDTYTAVLQQSLPDRAGLIPS